MTLKKTYKSDALEAVYTPSSERTTRKPVLQTKLSLTPKELDKALRVSADRRKRLAAAFGLKVPGYKLIRVKE
jgi:hypothetical protein